MTQRIEIVVEAMTMAEAVACFEAHVARLKQSAWRDGASAGGGAGGPSFSVYVGRSDRRRDPPQAPPRDREDDR